MKSFKMNIFLQKLLDIREFFGEILEPNLWWIQGVAFVLSLLFLIGIIYIIRKTGYIESKREKFLDILGSGAVSRRRSLRAWTQIKERLKSDEQNQWKLAILEADHMLNEILKMSGYLGAKLEDKVDLITPAQLSNIEEVKNAHAVRNKVATDPTYELTKEEAEEVIQIYKQAFKELNLIRE